LRFLVTPIKSGRAGVDFWYTKLETHYWSMTLCIVAKKAP